MPPKYISNDCAETINLIYTIGLELKDGIFDLDDVVLNDDGSPATQFTLTEDIEKKITNKAIRDTAESQFLSDDFLRSFFFKFDNETWKIISDAQCLNTAFIKDFHDKLNWDMLAKNEYLDDDVNLNNLRKEIKEIKPIAVEVIKTQERSENTKMATSIVTKIATTAKSDSKKVALRIVSKKLVKGMIAAFLILLKEQKCSSNHIKMVAAFLNTEMGNTLVSGIIGMGLTYAPVEKIQSNVYIQYIAEDFRVSALENIGSKVIDMMTSTFLPVIMECAKELPELDDDDKLDYKKPAKTK